MPLVTLLQADLIFSPVFLSLWNTPYSKPNIRSSSILTKTASDDVPCAVLTKPSCSGGLGGGARCPSTLAGSRQPARRPDQRRGHHQLWHYPLSKGPSQCTLHSERGRVRTFPLPDLRDNRLFSREGNCMSLKSCYPYFKIPSLAMSDTWVMGLYDTCSYDGPSGRSVSRIH